MQADLRRLAATAIVTLALSAGAVAIHDPPSAAGDADQAIGAPDGQSLFLTKGCIGCHTIRGLPGGGGIGPDLTDLPNRAATRLAGLTAPEYVRQSVTAPQAFVVPGYSGPAQVMPALPVTPGELDALIGYLLSDH